MMLYTSLAILALVALVVLGFRRFAYRGLGAVVDVGPDSRYSRRRENARRYRRICNGPLTLANGLYPSAESWTGPNTRPEIVPRPPRAQYSPRASLRRVLRTMKARGHALPG